MQLEKNVKAFLLTFAAGRKALEAAPFKRKPSVTRFRLSLSKAIREMRRDNQLNKIEFVWYKKVFETRHSIVLQMSPIEVVYSHCCGIMQETAKDWAEIERWWDALVVWIKQNWAVISQAAQQFRAYLRKGVGNEAQI